MTAHTQPRGTAARRRRPYRPPELTRVRLEADQVLGISCKTATTGPSSLGTCYYNSCASVGS
jgi:hypothetical protein